MKKSALRCLILTCLFTAALCGWNKLVDVRMSWSEARQYCREHYIDLTSIRNLEEDENLRKLPNRLPRGWIGLHIEDNDSWKWSGGENATFFNWLEEPDEIKDNKCVVYNHRGWLNINCKSKLHFYCSDNSPVLVKENKTWEEAMKWCRDQKKDLVSLPSNFTLVQTLATRQGAQTDHVWTGMRYLADRWLWVSGEIGSYRPLSRVEMAQCPGLTHRCGALSLQGQRLEDWDCADKLNFLCDENT